MVVKLAVISAGLGDPSSTRLLADRLYSATQAALQPHDSATGLVIELRTVGRGIVDAMLTGFGPPELQAIFDAVADVDGLIAVTPAFNASFSGLFKSFFDVLPEEFLAQMPVLIAATGGTERHSLVLEHAMRPMFSYLHAVVSPTAVYAATDDFGTSSAAADLSARITKAGTDFVRLLRSCGPRVRPDSDAEDLFTMEQLLGGTRPNGNGAVED